MMQSGGFLGRLLGPSLKTGLPLIKNVIKPLAKSILISLRLTAAESAADSGIQKASEDLVAILPPMFPFIVLHPRPHIIIQY